MPRGPDPTTRRSTTQGGKELRARVSAEEYARVKADAEAERMTVPAYVRRLVLGGRYRDILPAVMAEVGPVQIDRPVVMVGAVEERSCFTCAHNRQESGAIAHWCDANPLDPRIGDYVVESGAIEADDAMPTNRDMRCPGWAAKETM